MPGSKGVALEKPPSRFELLGGWCGCKASSSGMFPGGLVMCREGRAGCKAFSPGIFAGAMVR